MDSVKIGILNISILDVENLHGTLEDGNDHWLYGRARPRLGKIEIDTMVTEESKPQILLHEIIHIILHQGGHEDHSEAIINCVAYGLIQVIRDNPELVKYIQFGLKNGSGG